MKSIIALCLVLAISAVFAIEDVKTTEKRGVGYGLGYGGYGGYAGYGGYHGGFGHGYYGGLGGYGHAAPYNSYLGGYSGYPGYTGYSGYSGYPLGHGLGYGGLGHPIIH